MEYRRFLDERSRLIVPASLRKKLGQRVIIQRDRKCLSVRTLEQWEEWATKILEGLPPESKKQVKRDLHSESSEEKFDSQGRILIPSFLENGLISGREVVVVDRGDHLQIWDRERYLARSH